MRALSYFTCSYLNLTTTVFRPKNGLHQWLQCCCPNHRVHILRDTGNRLSNVPHSVIFRIFTPHHHLLLYLTSTSWIELEQRLRVYIGIRQVFHSSWPDGYKPESTKNISWSYVFLVSRVCPPSLSPDFTSSGFCIPGRLKNQCPVFRKV